MTEVKRAVVVHGLEASPAEHWFPWLKAELEAHGYKTTVVELPNSDAPVSSAWQLALRAELPAVDEHTVVIGMSLGCITALRHLSSLGEPWTLGHLVLVSGFLEKLSTIPSLDEFIGDGVDVSVIRKNLLSCTVISSDNDQIVDPALTADMAAQLDANLEVVPGAGHFLGGDGFTELPQVLTALGLS